MPDVEFTQYLRPDGRPKQIVIDRPQHLYEKARQIIESGYWFEAEVLTTGEVSLTVSDAHGDHAFEIVPNGPDVPAAVDRLIAGFELPHDCDKHDCLMRY